MNRDDVLRKERIETDTLKLEALKLGIEIPHHKSWWQDDFDNFGGSVEEQEPLSSDHTYLTEVGKAGVRKLIREKE